MFTFSIEIVKNEREAIAATASDAFNIVSPVWGQYGSSVSSLWPLGGNTKIWKVDSGYWETLSSHARSSHILDKKMKFSKV